MTGAALSAGRRARELAALRSAEPADLLVVGGGITGTGIALDAAARGLSVVLVERGDLASGTSRWSSKLAHGGLRYIVAGQLGVAWESAVERNRLFRYIAPHLVQQMLFVIPAPPGVRTVDRVLGRVGMGIADGLRAASRTPAVLPRTKWVDGDEIRRLLPALRESREAALHVDGSLEDDARLVVGVARTAASYGARILTHTSAQDVHASGATVVDELTGESFDVAARVVVVAAGVWSGGLVADVPLQPSKGAHLLLRAEALGRPRCAFNILVPGSRNRYVFAVPRPDGTVQVGLTDDAVDAVEDVPAVTADEERFLLETLSSGLSAPVTPDDIVGRFAGLRPLLGAAVDSNPADLSRRHALLEREGVLVLVGGKLTTYRAMAEDAVDRVVARLGVGGGCVTRTLPLVGAASRGAVQPALPHRLSRRFGSDAAAVAASGPVEPVAAGVPALKCEVGWALTAEGAVTVEDVERRLRLDLVPAWRDAARGYLAEVVSHSVR
jgi:glycerol-3-phosphate dehydrogenase